MSPLTVEFQNVAVLNDVIAPHLLAVIAAAAVEPGVLERSGNVPMYQPGHIENGFASPHGVRLSVIDPLANVDAVFWAIGLNSIGVEEDRYREIHVGFPSRCRRVLASRA